MESSFSFSKETVGFFIDGVVDEDRIDQLHHQILDKLEQHEKINLYLEDSGIESFTLPAIAEQIKFKLTNSDSLNKVALVTDRKWIQACAAIENLFLSTTIRSFPSEERLRAISWIAER